MSPRGDDDPFAPDRPRRRLKPLGKLVVYGGLGGAFVAGAAAVGLWFWRPAAQLPRLMPADAQAALLLRPTVRALVGLPMLRRAYPEAFDLAALRDARADMERELGVSFEADVLPWVGAEAGLAVVAPPKGEAGAMLAVTVRDAAAADACLAKVAEARRLRGDRVEARMVEGAAYHLVTRAATGGRWAFGRVGPAVAMTDSEAGFQALLARAKGPVGATLAGQAAFRDVEAALPRDSVFTGFLAGGPGATRVARDAMAGAPALARDAADWLDALRGSGFGVGLRADGVEIAAVMALDPERLGPNARKGLDEVAAPVAPGLVREAPADALAAVAVRFPAAARDALAAIWREQQRKDPRLGGLDAAGLDVERDLLAWLPGDMAFVALPAPPEAHDFPIVGYVDLRPTDRALADGALDRLEAAVAKAVAGSPATQDHEKVGGRSWNVLRERLTGKTWLAWGRDAAGVRLAVGPGVYERISAPGATLAGTPGFKAVDAYMPRPHSGMFFFDLAGMQQVAKPLLTGPNGPSPAARRRLASLRALGGASTPGISAKGMATSTLFLHMTEPPQ